MIRSLLATALAFSALPAMAAAPSNDLAATPSGQSALIDVLANDLALGAERRLVSALQPRNGRVSVVDGWVRYTPKAGFTGTDRFDYLVQAGPSAPSKATVTVLVGQSGARTLQLQGQVVDSPVPLASVIVRLGGYDFVARADEQGRYVLTLVTAEDDGMVTLKASGTSQSGVPLTFYSVVGELSRLIVESGDGVLTRDENNQVQVTNLSTAQFVLLQDANGGETPDGDSELTPLLESLNLQQMLEFSALLTRRLCI